MEDEVESGPINIVKIASVLLIGVILLTAIDTGVGSQMNSGTTISLNDFPNDGDTINIGGYIFEFDDNSNTGANNIPVVIDSTISGTVDNLETAIGGV